MGQELYGKVRKWVFDQALGVLIVTCLTIVLGIVLSELQAKMGWAMLLVSLSSIFALFMIVIWLVVRPVLSMATGIGDQIQETLEKYVSPEKVNWLLTTLQLADYERRTKAPEIWLITSDLSEDIIGEPFNAVVSEKLKNGVRYRYFVPNTLEIRARVGQMVRSHGNVESLKVTYLSDEFFFLVPRFDFVIYDPFGGSRTERVAYMGIPVPGEVSHYHARVDHELTDVLIGKLMQMIEAS